MNARLNKLFVIALLSLFGVNGAIAQGLYRAGQTINGNGFTYICETPWAEPGLTVVAFPGDIRLRNINNTFTGMRQKAGNTLVSIVEPPVSYDGASQAFKKFHNIINSVLSNAEKQMADRDMLIVELHIDSQTGKIVDIEFNFNVDTGFAKIAPEKYYRIETQLKQQVTFQINSIGREYNFNYASWAYMGGWFGKTIP